MPVQFDDVGLRGVGFLSDVAFCRMPVVSDKGIITAGPNLAQHVGEFVSAQIRFHVLGIPRRLSGSPTFLRDSRPAELRPNQACWPVGRFGRLAGFGGPQLVERHHLTAVLARCGPLLIPVENWVIFGGLWTKNLLFFDEKNRNLAHNRTLEARGSTPLSSTSKPRR